MEPVQTIALPATDVIRLHAVCRNVAEAVGPQAQSHPEVASLRDSIGRELVSRGYRWHVDSRTWTALSTDGNRAQRRARAHART